MHLWEFSITRNIAVVEDPVVPTNPCQPSPCGPNAQCKEINGSPSCSCLPEFIGTPPGCRPECSSNSECANHLACVNNKCKDPCPGICGSSAECRVISHTPNCVCLPGYTGDPFVQCSIYQPPAAETTISPCQPSPCGANAQCRVQNTAGACICLPEYIGNPYEGCRPECVLSSDCPSNKACMRNKCLDPCPGTCGQNANCQVINHSPSCTCIPGYTGDPFRFCNLPPPERKSIQTLKKFRLIIDLIQLSKMKLPKTRVNLVRVDQTANVGKSTDKPSALAYPITSEVLPAADLSVLSAQSVHKTKPALTKNVPILVLELVVLMPNVK